MTEMPPLLDGGWREALFADSALLTVILVENS